MKVMLAYIFAITMTSVVYAANFTAIASTKHSQANSASASASSTAEAILHAIPILSLASITTVTSELSYIQSSSASTTDPTTTTTVSAALESTTGIVFTASSTPLDTADSSTTDAISISDIAIDSGSSSSESETSMTSSADNPDTTADVIAQVKLGLRAPGEKNGPFSYWKAMAKFNSKLTLQEAVSASVPLTSKALAGSSTSEGVKAGNLLSTMGFAASTGASDDSQWLTELQIGTPPQTLLLNFDTGSSDLWVFSTDLPIAERQKQVLYNPASSTTALAAPSSTWNITYADASGASGFVGVDTVVLGGKAITNQAVQRATHVSKDFFSSQMASGLLGLAFSAINTVKPNPVITPMDNMIKQGLIQNPIFTVTLKDSNSNATGRGGHFTFGALDSSSYRGQITYAAVNTSQGFWQVNSPYFKIGRNGNPIPRSAQGQTMTTTTNARSNIVSKDQSVVTSELDSTTDALSVLNAESIASQMLQLGVKTVSRATNAGGLQQLAVPEHAAIIDTGTTLMLIDDRTLLTIYNSIPGAVFNQSVGGYTLPCTTTSPDTFYMIGDSFFGIPGSSLPFAPLDHGMCFGGIQSRGSFPMDIYGDTFIKNNYVVFDQGTVPKVGVAYRPDIVYSTT